MFSTFEIAFNAIRANKLRALLTMLGIIIGISAVIAMLSIGQGAQAVILEQVQGLGANTITIVPVSNFNGGRSQAELRSLVANRLDNEILKKLTNKIKFPSIDLVAAELSGSYDVSYRSSTLFRTVYGVNPDYFAVRDLQLSAGRFLTQADERGLRRVVVLGPTTVENLFGLDEAVGKDIKINGFTYQVVGVLAAKSGVTDTRIYLPLNTASKQLIGGNGVGQIIVKVASEDVVDPTALQIEDELRDYYRIAEGEEENFTVFTSNDIQSLAQTVTGIFTSLLASIAGISLMVGGIGIMNIMLVSVTERTREIGLRKAIGAPKRAILGQFLMESMLLTLLGGVIGIVVGILAGMAIGAVAGFQVVIAWQSIALATSVSAGIGIVFGYYPAYRAASLNPIDALRYE